MQQTKSLLVVAALMAMAGLAAPARAMLIDGFGTATGSVTSSGNAQFQTFLTGDAIGGTRTLRVESPQFGQSTLAVTPLGELQFSGSGCVGCTGRVTWNANGNGLGPVSLLGGSNAIALQLLSLTETVQLEVVVTDAQFNQAVLSQVVDAFSSASQALYFEYAAFADLGSQALRFDLVQSISLRLRTGGDPSGPSNAVMRLGAIETGFVAPPPPPPPPPPTHQVSLPGSLLLALTALASARVGSLRRSSRKSTPAI